MSHEIETLQDGTALAVFNRVPAWHTLGTVVENDRLTVAEAMRAARLNDWNVRKVPVIGVDGDDTVEYERYAMTVRNNLNDPHAPAQPLGIVSQDEYVVVQNEEAFAFAETVVSEGLFVDAGGSLFGGRQVWMLFRTPETIKIGGADEVQPYIHVTTSHDATLAVTVNFTGIRVVCANTQEMALSAPTPRFAVKHVGLGEAGLDARVGEARRALDLTFTGMTAFQAEAERLLATEVTRRKFDKIVEGLFPEPKDASVGTTTRVQAKRDEFRRLHDDAPTQEGVRGTAWGVLQAAWELDEWVLGNSQSDEARALRSVRRTDERRQIASKVLELTA